MACRKFNARASKVRLHNKWSEYVRKRDKYICQWCGKHEEPANAHHIIAKSICQNAGRFEVENGMTLCVHCHMNLVPTMHDEYVVMRDKWLAARGLNYFDLRAKYVGSVKFTQELFELKFRIIEEMIKELK